jgi:ABC-type molybdate transport system substrate-binding protein
MAADGPVVLYAAGSLRAAMTEVGEAYAQRSGVPVKGEFGASGLMRERIEKGEPAEMKYRTSIG